MIQEREIKDYQMEASTALRIMPDRAEIPQPPKSLNDIAAALGVSRDTVKRDIKSAKKKFERRMLALLLLEQIEIAMGRQIREDEEDAVAEFLAELYKSEDPLTLLAGIVVSYQNGN